MISQRLLIGYKLTAWPIAADRKIASKKQISRKHSEKDFFTAILLISIGTFDDMARVVFLQNIKNVAQIGDVKNVADGYARNFLLPRKLAVLANETAMKAVENLKQKRLLAIEKDKESTGQLAEKIKSFTLVIERVTNEEGTLYDGVNAVEISSALKKEGFAIEPESILLKEPAKKVGSYEAGLK
ncbi:MAG: 50S ribosomal protein L9 [Candidatus Yanofskybacteria bacterium]|nr:50S ribosomal protein L9 [Candidatus Yanofskybacteria bacterium]